MDKNEKQAVTIFLMAKNEETVSRLYQVFNSKFPQMTLWSQLANDEMKHAQWLRELAGQIGEGKVFFDDDRFEIGAIQSFGNDIKQSAEDAKNNNLSPLNALALAHDAEEALLEKRYLEVFEGDDPALKDILSKLQKETEEHRDKVNSALQEIKANKKILEKGL